MNTAPRVQVYVNLHLTKTYGQPVYSVRDKRTRRVIDHVTAISLADAHCKVSQAGRERVVRERRKNVHAFVEGTMAPVPPDHQSWRAGTYNPYRYKTFVDRLTEAPVVFADYVVLDGAGLRYR